MCSAYKFLQLPISKLVFKLFFLHISIIHPKMTSSVLFSFIIYTQIGISKFY